ncbi:major facilitator superfamily protein [Rhizobium phaseoli]|uniref:Probable transporter permease protein n=1 Tax=Rhizobium etli (strain CIAT 652) TaxID=491916 RepID=B3PZ20_RHIE6|nr:MULTISPECIES: MFS transporter [Rhizobium]ACE92684.1 probable transporter permease protein [Rhizobium etli CIAT 652]EGE56031.1 putative transporter permease protein [Rhizobium etli CNPAF512]KEC74493.1 transporter permease [Rhizobium leguminosarum bv. phaseoli CCGM1]MDH6650591.1 MFS family permease [Rhizobium esperanzae]ANK87148.1 major facilitator superfamily protein [Rhizobium sp. N731]
MKRNLLSVAALLFGTLFLFMGNGLQGILLPVRGNLEGYATTTLGLLGTSWAAGFVIGCLVAPKLVRRVGHVRAFSGFISIIAIIALVSGIIIHPVWWVVLRAVTGFSTAGTSMIIESWLNERASNESRGAIFSLYIGITLLGVVGGQMMIPLEDVRTPVLFMICGIFYCIAMLPTTLSTAASPQPLKAVRLDLPALYRNSPVSCLGILLVGIANGAYGTLGAVFGAGAGLSDTSIAIMMSATIFAGAMMQLPAGRLSDRIDRRYVLAAMSAIAALAGLLIFMLHPTSPALLIGLVVLYGAVANTLYPIAVAHANDFAASEDFVKVSGGLLLLYGIGTVIGPTLGGPVMSAITPHALFLVTAVAHVLITGYAIVRSRIRAAVPASDRDAYTTIPTGTSPMLTPESMSLADRGTGKSPESGDPAVKFG